MTSDDDTTTEHQDWLRAYIAEVISGARIAPLYPSMEGSYLTPAKAADAVVDALALEATMEPRPYPEPDATWITGRVPPPGIAMFGVQE